MEQVTVELTTDNGIPFTHNRAHAQAESIAVALDRPIVYTDYSPEVSPDLHIRLDDSRSGAGYDFWFVKATECEICPI